MIAIANVQLSDSSKTIFAIIVEVFDEIAKIVSCILVITMMGYTQSDAVNDCILWPQIQGRFPSASA